MASKTARKAVAKKKKDDLVQAIRGFMEEEFETLSAEEYGRIYAQEFHKREGDSADIFSRIAYNKNLEMLSKLRKKPLEDLYVAYLEIKESGFKGPVSDKDPEIPS